jgi:predicted RNA-binding Zn-ribbon protein involved in translation (DUF1610 family)
LLAILVAVVLTAIGVISLAAAPVWPVLGVAFATVALVFNTMTSRLAGPVCWGCGQDIAKQPSGEYGITCPKCGMITHGLDDRPDSD